MVLYICRQCEDDPYFDEEKLKAIMFRVDFTAYLELGHSISGLTYWKEPLVSC